MTETTHARSRRASLFGLLLQVIVAMAAYALTIYLKSAAMQMLALLLAGGTPMWFITLLVFRQRELAALEEMDLEELRREREASGAGEALFSEEGGGDLGFRVAQARLQWMQRWLIPIFSLVNGVLLLAGAGLGWMLLSTYAAGAWPQLESLNLGLILSALIMLFLFFYSRYASGMARVPEWQLLRGCGAYMLGCAFGVLALIVCYGVTLYKETVSWEHYVAYAIMVLMAVLGAEMLLNFVLDIYRPRSRTVEPRAAFDSRLLGLIAEPGGIAQSLADSINYQFGFKVSQTWFYLLLQRTVIWLVGAGAVAVWALSAIVIVQPYEHVIIERFGRQINADAPLGPGIYLKWPAPIELARKYSTGRIHEFYIGYEKAFQPKEDPKEIQARAEGKAWTELWTDEQHDGRNHFDFVIAPTPTVRSERDGRGPATIEEVAAEAERAAQHLVRMLYVVQYKIQPEQLPLYTQRGETPEETLREIAWREISQLGVSYDIHTLMGEMRSKAGAILQERISERAAQLELGLDVVFVGLLQIHPHKEVSLAFREVVTAQEEKKAEIRKARVTENETLSRVAGDRDHAVGLGFTLDAVQTVEYQRNELERMHRAAIEETLPRIADSFAPLEALIRDHVEAKRELDLQRRRQRRVRDDFELGLGGSQRDVTRTAADVAQAEARAAAAKQALDTARAPIRREVAQRIGDDVADALLRYSEVRVASIFWYERLERYLRGLEGQAAVTLAQAQARRWKLEMGAAGEVAVAENERYAYNAAPEIFKTRRFLHVLVNGVRGARKYFLGFDPGEGKVHLRLQTEEEARPDLLDIPTNLEPQ